MSLETFGKLYDIITGSGIVKVELVGNEKSSGLEITFVDGSISQQLVMTIPIKEPENQKPEEKKNE